MKPFHRHLAAVSILPALFATACSGKEPIAAPSGNSSPSVGSSPS